MLKVRLKRTVEASDHTRGLWKIEGVDHPEIHTLEEPWKGNQRQISCIPKGEYICKPHNGTRFKNVWQVTNVPNRTAILIHAGNTTLDIEGCILVGLSIGHIVPKGQKSKFPAVLSSVKALNMLRNLIGVKNSFILIVE